MRLQCFPMYSLVQSLRCFLKGYSNPILIIWTTSDKTGYNEVGVTENLVIYSQPETWSTSSGFGPDLDAQNVLFKILLLNKKKCLE